MTSVERVIEYAKLPTEGPLETNSEVLKSFPENWPALGTVVFKNVSVKYSEKSSFVLQHLNFEIKGNVRTSNKSF